jgi:hypothetical protein
MSEPDDPIELRPTGVIRTALKTRAELAVDIKPD